MNWIGPISEMGYGVASANFVHAIVNEGENVSLFPIGGMTALQHHHDSISKALSNAQLPDWNAPCVRMWHQFDMSQWVGGERIGFPIFELLDFTKQELHHLGHCDRLFVCSKWAQGVVDKHFSNMRCEVVPLGVDIDIFKPSGLRAYPSTAPTKFFTCGKAEIRKGHDVLPDIFSKAFTPQDNVELNIMIENPFFDKAQMNEFYKKFRESPMKDKINILPRLNTQYELSKVMNEQDCGIFMNRAEGWNLELLEMMACGKWTVYTNYSGHTEFCEGLGGVDIIELEPAIDGVWFNGSSQWAHIGEEQIDEAVHFLRMIHQKVQSNDRFNQTGFDIAQEYTWKNAARKLLETL